MGNDPLNFLHSLLRYAVLLTLVYAFVVNLRGWLANRPIHNSSRSVTIIAMVMCHVQLLLGLILYAVNWSAFKSENLEAYHKFMKYEHAGTMLIAIALITVGRVLSKKAATEALKQRHIAMFYGIGLLLILWAIPWPFKAVGHSLGWL